MVKHRYWRHTYPARGSLSPAFLANNFVFIGFFQVNLYSRRLIVFARPRSDLSFRTISTSLLIRGCKHPCTGTGKGVTWRDHAVAFGKINCCEFRQSQSPLILLASCCYSSWNSVEHGNSLCKDCNMPGVINFVRITSRDNMQET